MDEWLTAPFECRAGIKPGQANSVSSSLNQIHPEQLFLVGSVGGIQWTDGVRYHRSSRIVLLRHRQES